MDDVVIRVEQVSKEYRLGVIGHETLSRDLQSKWARFRGREDPNQIIDPQKVRFSFNERFQALTDISFNVRRGEIVGIIGRNGAGKSTLLKILSRVTSPTTGRIIINGRIASLLEVGTGFHPELTGRENIFLNGAILGMTKSEITEKFDDIIMFSGIEQFIDTPVKRYSSGMYVRLAFAVAAFLEPEILIVDEVLAVGDAEFQKRCLGKMEDVAKGGRTILFVSHNTGAIQRICKRTILLSEGELKADGNTLSIIDLYLSEGISQQGERKWAILSEAPGNEIVRLLAIRALNKDKKITSEFSIREPIFLEMEFFALKGDHNLEVAFEFFDSMGTYIFGVSDFQDDEWQGKIRPIGKYQVCCEIPGDLLNEGQIRIRGSITSQPLLNHVCENDALTIKILDNPEGGGARGNYTNEWPGGFIRPLLQWRTKYYSYDNCEEN